jgi:hypothetical protein
MNILSGLLQGTKVKTKKNTKIIESLDYFSEKSFSEASKTTSNEPLVQIQDLAEVSFLCIYHVG